MSSILTIDDDPDDVPDLTGVPSEIRELTLRVHSHGRSIRGMSYLVRAVIAAVFAGSMSVAGSIIGAAWYLGARMERLEVLSERVAHLEARMEAQRENR